jgi:hypothetical protein
MMLLLTELNHFGEYFLQICRTCGAGLSPRLCVSALKIPQTAFDTSFSSLASVGSGVWRLP